VSPGPSVGVVDDELVKLLRDTADRLEAEDHGGLRGVVVVCEGKDGVFVGSGPATGAWVEAGHGYSLYAGLLLAASDVAVLRDAKRKKAH